MAQRASASHAPGLTCENQPRPVTAPSADPLAVPARRCTTPRAALTPCQLANPLPPVLALTLASPLAHPQLKLLPGLLCSPRELGTHTPHRLPPYLPQTGVHARVHSRVYSRVHGSLMLGFTRELRTHTPHRLPPYLPQTRGVGSSLVLMLGFTKLISGVHKVCTRVAFLEHGSAALEACAAALPPATHPITSPPTHSMPRALCLPSEQGAPSSTAHPHTHTRLASPLFFSRFFGER